MGTAIVTDIGRDLTGQKFGDYVAPLEFTQAMTDSFDRVLALGQPVFEDSLYETDFGSVHAVSRLLLPLTGEAAAPMLILSRIVRRFHQIAQVRDHLKGAKGALRGRYDIGSLSDLQTQLAAWEQSVSGHSPAGASPDWVSRVRMRRDDC
jgi:hypothetical protein